MARPAHIGRNIHTHLPTSKNRRRNPISFPGLSAPLDGRAPDICFQRRGCEFPTATGDCRRNIRRVPHVAQATVAKFKLRPCEERLRRRTHPEMNCGGPTTSNEPKRQKAQHRGSPHSPQTPPSTGRTCPRWRRGIAHTPHRNLLARERPPPTPRGAIP